MTMQQTSMHRQIIRMRKLRGWQPVRSAGDMYKRSVAAGVTTLLLTSLNLVPQDALAPHVCHHSGFVGRCMLFDQVVVALLCIAASMQLKSCAYV